MLPDCPQRNWLSDPNRIKELTHAVRAKVPPRDVEDIVQTTLADALVAETAPTDPAQFERWLHGIARHKIADYYRRNRKGDSLDIEHADLRTAESSADSARDILRWLNRELPKEGETSKTLEWMMREASGDCLESIAEEQKLSAPLVRQRVSRLRRHLRERWAMQLSAVVGMLVVATGLYAYFHQRKTALPISPETVRVVPQHSPQKVAESLRRDAALKYQNGEWKACLELLERAKVMDPVGDSDEEYQTIRASAEKAIRSEALPVPSVDPVPSAIPKPRPAPLPPPKKARVQKEPSNFDFDMYQKKMPGKK